MLSIIVCKTKKNFLINKESKLVHLIGKEKFNGLIEFLNSNSKEQTYTIEAPSIFLKLLKKSINKYSQTYI